MHYISIRLDVELVPPDQVIGLLDVFTAEIALDRLRDL